MGDTPDLHFMYFHDSKLREPIQELPTIYQDAGFHLFQLVFN